MADNNTSVNEFLTELENEYEQAQKTLKEIEMMLDQSQSELSKLIQRNTSANSHLQQIQNQFDTIPRTDIRQAYNSAIDSTAKNAGYAFTIRKASERSGKFKEKGFTNRSNQRIFP